MRRFSREMDDVLPGSASDLEHKATIGQRPLQHFPDRPLVALRRGADEAPLFKMAQRFAPHRRLTSSPAVENVEIVLTHLVRQELERLGGDELVRNFSRQDRTAAENEPGRLRTGSGLRRLNTKPDD